MRKRDITILSMIFALFLSMAGMSLAGEEPSDIEKLTKTLSTEFNFKVSEADIIKLLQKGFGFNRIVKVYIMAAKSGKSPEEVVKLWEKTGSIGTTIKELGLKLTSGDLRKEAIAILRKAGIEEHGEEPTPEDAEKFVKALKEIYNYPASINDVMKMIKMEMGFNRIAKVYILVLRSGENPIKIAEMLKTNEFEDIIAKLKVKIDIKELNDMAKELTAKAGVE